MLTALSFRRCLSLLVVCVGVLLFACQVQAQQIIFVDISSEGNNDGTSWEDAFNDLQDALAIATSGKRIWVAKGTYKPTDGTDRNISFVMKDGVDMYGGFAGNEDPATFDLDDRDFITNATTLSGDLLGNDNDNLSPSEPTRADNSYTVVMGADAVLDGFTVTGGNADSTPSFPYSSPQVNGGGMFNLSVSPTVRNCIFHSNSVTWLGGGMHNRANSSPIISDTTFSTNYASSGGGLFSTGGQITITDSSFLKNSTPGRGAGMYTESANSTITDTLFSENSGVDGGGFTGWSSTTTMANVNFLDNTAQHGAGVNNMTNSHAQISHAAFSGNQTTGRGGAIDNHLNSSVTITSSTFSNNSAGTRGGGIHSISSTTTISRSTFTGNSAALGGALFNGFNATMISNTIISKNTADYGGGMYHMASSNVTITNVTFSGNTATNGDVFASGFVTQANPSTVNVFNTIIWNGEEWVWNNEGTTYNITYSNVEGGHPGTGNSNVDPLFADPDNEDYHLQSQGGRWHPATETWVLDDVTSLCIDAGDPASDFSNEPDPNGGRINMGAFGNTEFASKTFTKFINVESTPGTGALISGNFAGVTNYVADPTINQAVSFTAEEQLTVNGEAYDFARWLIAGVSQPEGQRTIEFTATADMTIVAQYEREPSTHTLLVQSTPVIGFDIEGDYPGTTNYSAVVNHDEVVNLIAPETDIINSVQYQFVRWTLDGTPQPAGQLAIQFTMTSDRTATAVYTAPLVPTDAVAMWRFEDNVLDDTGVNHGTQFGGTFINGQIGRALSLSRSTNDYVNFGNHPSLNFNVTQSFSISMWVRRNSHTWIQEEDLIAKHSNSWQGWRVGFASWGGRPRLYFGAGNLTSGRYVYGRFVEDTEWHHLAAILDRSANTISIWSDGVLSGTVAIPAVYDVNASESSVNLGRRNAALLRYFDGTIDQTRIYARVLNPEEIEALFRESTLPAHTLYVQSTPVTGVSITGSRPGTTNYTAICEDQESVTLIAPLTIPNTSYDYEFVRWLLDGIPQPDGQNEIQFTMTADRTAIAEYVYVPVTYLLTVQSTPVTGIEIDGTRPGITNYVRECDEGEIVTLIAPLTATIGSVAYNFSHWILDAVPQPSGQATLQIVIDADMTATAVYELSPVPTDVVASWRFEDNVLDDTGINHGVLLGGAFVPGRVGQGLSLSRSTNDYVNFGNDPSLNFGIAQSFSISLWVRRNVGAWTQEEDIIAKHSTSWQGWRVGFANWGGRPRVYFGAGDTSGARFAFGPFIADTQWHHIVAILDRSTNIIRIWSDGILLATTAIPAGYNVNAAGFNVNVGRRNSALLRYLDGSVDQIRIYPRVLTPAEIQLLFDETAIPQYNLSVQSEPVVGIEITGTYPGTTNYTSAAAPDEQVSLTAPQTAEIGGLDYSFVRWTLDGSPQTPGEMTINLEMNTSRSAVAEYEVALIPRTLNVQSTPVIDVSVEGTRPGTTNYTAVCDNGEVVSLIAMPVVSIAGTDYTFVRWMLDGVPQQQSNVTVEFTMTADRTAVAEYEVSPIALDYVASWRLEGNVLDDTGVNHGTRFGGDFVPGRIGQGLALSRSTNDYVNFGNDQSLNFGTAQSFSISLWVKRSTATWTQEEDIISKHSNSWQGWRVGFATWGGRPRLYFGAGNTSGARFAYGAFVEDTQWHHIVAILDRSAGNIRIWTDGVLSGTTSIPVGYDVNPAGANVNVGRRNASLLRYFDGTVDQIRIYPRVLTPSEIQALYDESNP